MKDLGKYGEVMKYLAIPKNIIGRAESQQQNINIVNGTTQKQRSFGLKLRISEMPLERIHFQNSLSVLSKQ